MEDGVSVDPEGCAAANFGEYHANDRPRDLRNAGRDSIAQRRGVVLGHDSLCSDQHRE